jgi:adenylate kinase family enzyme
MYFTFNSGPQACNPILSRREDDCSKDLILHRFDEYDSKTAPLLEFFNPKGD